MMWQVHGQCHAPHRETGIETMLNVGACPNCLEARGGNMRKLAWDMGEFILTHAFGGGDLVPGRKGLHISAVLACRDISESMSIGMSNRH